MPQVINGGKLEGDLGELRDAITALVQPVSKIAEFKNKMDLGLIQQSDIDTLANDPDDRFKFLRNVDVSKMCSNVGQFYIDNPNLELVSK